MPGFLRDCLSRHHSVPSIATAAVLWAWLPAFISPLKYIEYGVYGDLVIIYTKPYSIYLRGTKGPPGLQQSARGAVMRLTGPIAIVDISFED